jgi:hypothetical protein
MLGGPMVNTHPYGLNRIELIAELAGARDAAAED